MRNALIVVGIGVIILAGGWWYLARMNTQTATNTRQAPSVPPSESNQPSSSPPSATMDHGVGIGDENTVEFACAGGKSMTAVFARDILGLTLSDGRQLTLRQAVSGSGIRYLNNTETIEFRGKGDDAFLDENGTITYEDCVAQNF